MLRGTQLIQLIDSESYRNVSKHMLEHIIIIFPYISCALVHTLYIFICNYICILNRLHNLIIVIFHQNIKIRYFSYSVQFMQMHNTYTYIFYRNLYDIACEDDVIRMSFYCAACHRMQTRVASNFDYLSFG